MNYDVLCLQCGYGLSISARICLWKVVNYILYADEALRTFLKHSGLWLMIAACRTYSKKIHIICIYLAVFLAYSSSVFWRYSRHTDNLYSGRISDIQKTCIPTVCLTYRVKYRFSVCQKYGRDTDKLSAGYISNIQIFCISDIQVKKYILRVFLCCMSGIQRSKPEVYTVRLWYVGHPYEPWKDGRTRPSLKSLNTDSRFLGSAVAIECISGGRDTISLRHASLPPVPNCDVS